MLIIVVKKKKKRKMNPCPVINTCDSFPQNRLTKENAGRLFKRLKLLL